MHSVFLLIGCDGYDPSSHPHFFSIIIYVSPSQTFKASWHLHQGGPLPPFLFILAAEGLSRYIKSVVTQGIVKGLRLWGHDFPLSCPQFVDNIMLFGEPFNQEIMALD